MVAHIGNTLLADNIYVDVIEGETENVRVYSVHYAYFYIMSLELTSLFFGNFK